MQLEEVDALDLVCRHVARLLILRPRLVALQVLAWFRLARCVPRPLVLALILLLFLLVCVGDAEETASRGAARLRTRPVFLLLLLFLCFLLSLRLEDRLALACVLLHEDERAQFKAFTGLEDLAGTVQPFLRLRPVADLQAEHVLCVDAGNGETVEVRVIAEVQLVDSVAY